MTLATRLRTDDRGGVTVLFLVLLPALIGFAALAWDGGRAANHRATVDDVAQSAARAGATAVVQPIGEPPFLDGALAFERAATILAEHPSIDGAITVTPDEVTVTTTGIYTGELAGRLGLGPWTFSGSFTSEMQVGVFVDGDTGG